MKKGERYRCPDDRCGCEIEVTKEARQGGSLYPRCCCGQEMELVRETVKQV
jgi:hypothetical protein